jgi:hypothetical protein
MLLYPRFGTHSAREVAPRSPGPAGPLMNERVKRSMETVWKYSAEAVVVPPAALDTHHTHKEKGNRLSSDCPTALCTQ